MQKHLWLSEQAVGRLSELLAAVATAPGTSDDLRYELDYCRSQVGELMPAVEVLVLAGVLREATDRAGLSAATRTDCWSWSSYLADLLTAGPTTTAPVHHLVPAARPIRNALLFSITDPDREGTASPHPSRLPVELGLAMRPSRPTAHSVLSNGIRRHKIDSEPPAQLRSARESDAPFVHVPDTESASTG